MELSLLARIVAFFGLALLILAGLLFLVDWLDIPLGKLPGDLRFQRGNFTCAVPLMSSLILSAILTLLLNLFIRYLNK